VSPQRIHWNRFEGKPLPPNTRLITRPSRWGNPFTIAECIAEGFADNEADARKACIAAYDGWLDGEPEYASVEPERRAWILANLHLLVGMDLACACKPGEPCHGDPLKQRVARHARQAVAS
jgi:hypothetical protein